MASEWVRVDSARNITEASLLKAALQAHEIEVGTRGEMLPSIAGELPVSEALIELWVRQEDLEGAREILAAARAPAVQLPPRVCPSCDEENPGNFDLCWKCQWPLPATESVAPAAPVSAAVPAPASERHGSRVWLAATLLLLLAAIALMLVQRASATTAHTASPPAPAQGGP